MGKSFAMKHFFSGNRFRLFTWVVKNPGISEKLTSDKIKCLHMFQCVAETNNSDLISSVGKCFDNQEIDLSNQTLLPSHLNTVCFFLIRSICKEWKRLDLSNCSIGDNGCDILSEWSLKKDARNLVSIKHVDIYGNQFGFLYFLKYSDLGVHQKLSLLTQQYLIIQLVVNCMQPLKTFLSSQNQPRVER